MQASASRLVKRLGLADVTSTQTEVCGLPALKLSFLTQPLELSGGRGAIPPRRASSVQIAYETNVALYLVTVTLQAVNPEFGAYQQDSTTIIEGFQVVPPAG